MITNTFVTEDGKYHVESLGNGWAYSVRTTTWRPLGEKHD